MTRATILLTLLIAAGGVHAQTLRVGIPAEPDTLDPVLSNTVASRLVLTAACDKLVDIDAQLAFVPQLAQSWEWGDNGASIVFHLRSGVVFQDGEPFDADAVRANLDRALTLPASRRRSEISAVVGVDVVDPLTVRLHMAAPFAPLLAQLADRAGMMVSPKALASAALPNSPVCAGPFRVVQRVPQDRMVLDRFDGYWNRANIHLGRVIFQPIPDAAVRLLNLRAGALEIADSPSATDLGQIRADPQLKLALATGLGHQNIIVNVGNGAAARNPLGQDQRVREALELSLDRAVINQVAFDGQNTVGNQPQPPGNPFYVAVLPPPARDVARARRLLTEAGYSRVPVELMVPTISEFQAVGEIVQSMAAEAGFDVTLRATELATSLQMARDGQFQAFLITWSGRVDPDANMYPFLHSAGSINDGRFANPDVDRLLDQARSTNDQAVRVGAYEAAARIYLAERPRLYLYHENRRWALRANLVGFVPMPDGLIRFTGLRLQ